MPSPASAPDATTRLRSAIDIGALALGTFVAVGVAAVLLIRRIATATAIAAFVMSSPVTAAGSRASAPPRVAPAHRPYASADSTTRPSRPDKADWAKIKTAASLRRLALAPHRTSRFRAFAAVLGLGELVSIHHLAPGRCLTAVTAVYDNLLDLENAYPGENWGPLRRAVAKEASIDACAPRPPSQDGA